MEELKVKNAIISKQGKETANYKRFLKLVKEKNIKVHIAKIDEKIKIENNINVEILWPSEALIASNILNNNSLVMKLTYNNFTMLFTGDIEKIAEEEIINKYEKTNRLSSTIIKIAHHGSKTSSIQEFINLAKPQIALIGVGKNNNFGHPNDEVLKRLEQQKSKIYRTDQMGEISININSKGKIKIKKFIEQEKLIEKINF